jgi:hypothetical protein
VPPRHLAAQTKYKLEEKNSMGAFRGHFCEGCRGELTEQVVNGVRYRYCEDCDPEVAEIVEAAILGEDDGETEA